jgi:hypothetical protein
LDGIANTNALPTLLFSDKALMRLIAFNARQVHHGQSRAAWTERLETAVVGITRVTAYEPYGTWAIGRHYNLSDFEPNLFNAVVCHGMGRTKGQGAKRSS